jgi:pyridoxal phosphate enzyme (YggS family)
MTALGIRANVKAVRLRVATAAERVGRDSGEVTIIGVTKRVDVERIRQAAACGLHIFGENRVQEAMEKIPVLGDLDAEWHFIGHLQTNKARRAAGLFQMIQSVDSISLAVMLDAASGERGERLPVLIEVNTSGEASKFGFTPTSLRKAFQRLEALPNLDVRGLMTVGPLDGGHDGARDAFRSLRELRDNLTTPAASLDTLSMGMTDDLEIAIEEGSTMVRVGRAIFGARS